MSDIKTLNGHNLVDTAATAKLNSVIESVGAGDTLTLAMTEEEILSGVTVKPAFVKVSNSVPTMNDFAGGCTLYALGGEVNATFAAEDITEPIDGFIMLPELWAVFISDSAVGVDIDGMVFPEKGTYTIMEFAVACTLTIPGYTGFATHTIKRDALAGVTSKILYADSDGYVYATSDTSDTSKRMTGAELMELYDKGVSLRIKSVLPSTSDMTVIFYFDGIGMFVMNDVVSLYTMDDDGTTNANVFHSAEYTPTTTSE